MSLQGKNETILACTICGVTPSQGSVGDVCVKCMLAAGFRPEQHASTRAVQSPRGFAPPSPNELKEDFPQLEIIELAGVGGMGAVYRAKEKGLDRIVALKILPRESATKPDFAVRFAQEAKALAKLNHKNIVQVYQADKNDRYFFFLMEFVDGINLRQAIQQGKLPPAEAMAIVPQICDALDFAHRNGVVHRENDRRRFESDRHPADHGHLALHGSRATPRNQHRRSSRRHLFSGRRVLRDTNGPFAVG